MKTLNSDNLVSILEQLGYKFIRHNGYLQCRANYRNGQDDRSVVIYPNENFFVDFVTNERGTLERLLSLTLHLNEAQTIEYLKSHDFDCSNAVFSINRNESSLKIVNTFPSSILDELIPVHEYWLNKGISLETIKLFRGGLDVSGRMKDRYVFPIFNEYQQIIGFIGRDTLNNSNKSRPKYKIIGPKSEFIWPLFLNYNFLIETKVIVLVESPHCILKLWESGIKNTLCLFGTDVSIPMLNSLLSLDPDFIVVSLNNEPDNNDIGKTAAIKVARKLVRYFDKRQIRIFLPHKKDFGEQTVEENKSWYKSVYNRLYDK